MSKKKKNLSEYHKKSVPSAKGLKFGILVSEWNKEITESMYEGAFNTLVKNGTRKQDILKKYVPGSFELTLGAQYIAQYTDVDAIICLGCVIQGETRHFEFICQAVAQGLTNISIRHDIPVIFGVLTTDTMEQAKARSGGKLGNKGDEAAISAIKMVHLSSELFEAFYEKGDELLEKK